VDIRVGKDAIWLNAHKGDDGNRNPRKYFGNGICL
jgi:hypothetical protein